MKGFVKNEGERPIHVLQRAVSPGFSITFEEAYGVVGKKSEKKRGAAFVSWLREAYFQAPFWVFYKDEGEVYFEDEPVRKLAKVRPAQGAGKSQVRRDDVREKKNVTVQRIIDSDIVAARPLIDKCKDRAILRTALATSKIRTGKEAHMRYLIRRLEQVYF
jgi:hypothetical protein